jgi:hypothetical protein
MINVIVTVDNVSTADVATFRLTFHHVRKMLRLMKLTDTVAIVKQEAEYALEHTELLLDTKGDIKEIGIHLWKLDDNRGDTQSKPVGISG